MKKILIFAILIISSMLMAGCKETLSADINYGDTYTFESEKLSKYTGLVWTSSDNSIASVNSQGEIVGNSPGTVNVTAMNNGKIVAEGTVNVNVVPITGIVLSTNSAEIVVDEGFQLNYTLFPDNASDYGISWRSADESVADINSDGYILAVSPGQTTISASNESGIMATCSVTVKDRPAYERLSKDEKSFVDLALKHINQFKNPDSVVIKGVYKSTVDASFDWLVAVSAQNGFGATNT